MHPEEGICEVPNGTRLIISPPENGITTSSGEHLVVVETRANPNDGDNDHLLETSF